MADDKNKMDERDRARVAGDQDYEVRYFAEVNGISMEQAKDLIDKHGNDRARLEQAVREIKTA